MQPIIDEAVRVVKSGDKTVNWCEHLLETLRVHPELTACSQETLIFFTCAGHRAALEGLPSVHTRRPPGMSVIGNLALDCWEAAYEATRCDPVIAAARSDRQRGDVLRARARRPVEASQ